jgi:predicted protein tyrosine phosphatase
MNLLFVCSENRFRSPTAEAVFSSYPGVRTKSAGTEPDAQIVVSVDLIEWADMILVMEQFHGRELNDRFKGELRGKRLVVLGIPDRYLYMDPELVRILKTKVEPYIR